MPGDTKIFIAQTPTKTINSYKPRKMDLIYLIIFFRSAFGILFAYSFVMKLKDVNQFSKAISNFKLLPPRWCLSVASLFLVSELAVVILMVIGGEWLSLAFGLGLFLLTIFTVALVSVLVREVQTTCNCFGTGENLVSRYEVWRNVVFILCSLVGWKTSTMIQVYEQPVRLIELTVLGFLGAIFILLLLHLSEIKELFFSINKN